MPGEPTSDPDEPEPAPAGRSRRRFFAPEVIQTSAMDCGPAALKCLLEGFGVGVSYGRLREACQTTVDGTSIDTLETLAQSLGLDAEQVMMPVDHLLLPEAEALPAIVVVRLPTGLTHFVVVWRGARRLGAGDGSGARAALGQARARSCATSTCTRMAIPAERVSRLGGQRELHGAAARAACARSASPTRTR